MASRDVIKIMDEFNWNVEGICQALIEARDAIDELKNELGEAYSTIEDMDIEGNM